ncbi:AI-2E family transporter [Nocardiopsis coralliicola]
MGGEETAGGDPVPRGGSARGGAGPGPDAADAAGPESGPVPADGGGAGAGAAAGGAAESGGAVSAAPADAFGAHAESGAPAPPAGEPPPGDGTGLAGGRGAGGHPNYFVLGFTGALGVLTAWMVVQALIGIQGVLVNILVALFLAIGLNPIIEALRRRGLPRWAAILAVCAVLVLLAAVFAWAVVPPLTSQIAGFAASAPQELQNLQEHGFIADLDRRFGILHQLQEVASSADFGQQVFGGVFGLGQAVLNSVFAVFTVLVLTLFFMASLPVMSETGYRLVPASSRARVRELGDEIVARVGDFIGGQLLIAAIGGLVAFLFLTAIGSGYALTLALVISITALIPLVGTTIGALAASAAVAVTDLKMGLITLVFFLVYQQIEAYVISPRIMQRSVRVPPTATITFALVGGALLGLVGALIAVPAAAAVLLILERVVFPRMDAR